MSSAASSQPSLSVSELNRRARRLLESQFGLVWVEGEVANLARPGSGHWYFSLRDERAQVRCAMFRNRNELLPAPPDNGQRVRARGRVSLYEGRGEFQLVVERLEPAGAGALQQAFERLKQKLLAEGLFDSARKRPLPAFPRHIAVVTSPSGAAVRDVVAVFRRRFPGARLSILPVPVQGEEAPPAICAALASLDRWHAEGRARMDAVIVCRGGGSLEDLWAFNDERVARAIAASALPVVSAVGHEIDFTIADFVADARAATPTAAAELLSPDSRELRQKLRMLAAALRRAQANRIAMLGNRLGALARALRHPGERLQEQAQRLDNLEIRLRGGARQQLAERRHSLASAAAGLARNHPGRRLERLASALQNHRIRLRRGAELRLSRLGERLARASAPLGSLGPRATLERGYAIVTDSAGRVLTSAGALRPGDIVATRLAEGGFRSEVTSD